MLIRWAQTHGGLPARVLLLTAPRLHCPLKCLQHPLLSAWLAIPFVFCRLCPDCSLSPAGFYSEVTSLGRPFHTAPQSLEPHDPILSHISLAPLSCIINTQLNYGIFVCTSPPTYTHRASLVEQLVKNPPAVQETRVRILGQADPLEKEMAAHSSILAWRIP